jgi:uncharacterized protein YkwD
MSALGLHRLCAALGGLAALALAGPAAAAQAHCVNADARPGVVSERAIGSATVCLINRERTRRGMRRLRVNRHLSRAALSHTVDMVQKRYFAHVSTAGLDLIDRLALAGYLRRAERWQVGENLARGIGSSGTPRRTVVGWIHSPAHRRNILDRRFREIGIGVIDGPDGSAPAAAAYTATFGYRR